VLARTVVVGAAIVLAAIVGFAARSTRSPEPGESVVVGAATDDRTPAPAAASATSPRLRWPPPALDDPVTVMVTNTNRHLYLRDDQDYVIDLPPNTVQRGPLTSTGGLVVEGGHDIVIIGGHVQIPMQELEFDGDPTRCTPTCPPIKTSDINKRRAMLFESPTGTVHVEGVLLNGEDISEGIDFNAPNSIVQVQNLRVENLHARDNRRFSDQHPDVLQPWGGVKELRVDRLTAETDYQAFKLHGTIRPVGRTHLRSVNVHGRPSARYLVWTGDPFVEWPIRFEDVWIQPGVGRSLRNSIYHPNYVDTAFDRISEYAVIDSPLVRGVVRRGTPPHGDFVPSGVAGGDYRSPGYVGVDSDG
jgi:hypothetical protein